MESVFQRAMELHQAGRPEDAAPLYEDVIRHDPRHPGAWHLLGVVHLGRGEFDTAREHIERALAMGMRRREGSQVIEHLIRQ